MFKPLLTLLRGSASRLADTTIDQNALLILDQQIKDCRDALTRAKKALAVAIAQNRQEQSQCDRLNRQIENLQSRAIQALDEGSEDLTREAAEAIAALENERETATEAVSGFSKECERWRNFVRTSEQRLKALERGRQSARANEAVLHLRDKGLIAGQSHQNTLCEAESTLERLRLRQDEFSRANAALDEFDADAAPKNITEKLADAGFGAPTRSRAQDVLERLKSASGPVSKKDKKSKRLPGDAA